MTIPEEPGCSALRTSVDLLVTLGTLATWGWRALARAWQPATFSATVIVLVGWDMLQEAPPGHPKAPRSPGIHAAAPFNMAY